MNKKSKILASFMIGSIAGGVAFAAEPVTDETLSDLIKKDKIITDMQKAIKSAADKAETASNNLMQANGTAEQAISIATKLDEGLKGLSTKVEGYDDQFGQLKQAKDDQEVRIADLEDTVDANKASITSMQEKVGKIGGIEDNKKAIAENAESITDIKYELNRMDADIEGAENDIEGNASNIETNTTDIAELKGKIGGIETNKADIIDLKGKIGGIEDNKKAIAENGESIIDIKYELNRMDADIEGVENDIEGNASNIEANATAIGENKTAIGENKTAIGENKTAIGENKTAIGENKLAIGQNKMAIGKHETAIGENRMAIAENRMAIGTLGNRVSQVGANVAALAALQPLEFTGEETWSIAGGYGHYNGKDAGALGVFYRPNEEALVSIGASFGGGEEMYNAGVSFRLGEGTSGVSTSKAKMAQEIRMLEEKDAEREAQFRILMERLEELEEELAEK